MSLGPHTPDRAHDRYRTSDLFIDSCVKFSLRRNIVFWKKELKPSSFVLNVLRQGYLIPFVETPPPFYAKNNMSAMRHASFVRKEITKLLKNGLIEELPGPSHCCNPLTVSDKGKLRLVLDLRHVNQYILLKKFRYGDLRHVAELFEQNDFFITFDLTSAYHHIDIHPAHHKFLGLHFEFNGVERYFIFTVLPFGLSPASYVLTKVMRPLTKRWRGKGIKSVVFIDDGIAAQKNWKSTKQAADNIERDLGESGFMVNREKSDFNPKQQGKWLGAIIDTVVMRFYVPKEKVENLKENIQEVLKGGTTPKSLAKIAGMLSSMHMSIGPLVRLFTRNIYREIAQADTWYQQLSLAQSTKEDLQFWLRNIENVNGCTFKHRPTTTQIIFTDASGDGYGGFMVQRLQELICSGKFEPHDRSQSSTYREVLAVKLVLQSYGEILRNQTVQVNMDNFGATRVLTIGSSKEVLQTLALDIFYHCLRNNIKLTPEWIPRDQNYDADYFSKINDSDGWGVDQNTFNHINSHFGPFVVDRFADNRNTKLSTFNSRYFCPGTSHVNAFTANWSNKNNWLCPPISLIGSTLRHLRDCKGTGTLLVPVWESAYYWPLLYPDGIHFAEFVKNILIINPYYESYGNNTTFKGYASFKSMALKVDFT